MLFIEGESVARRQSGVISATTAKERRSGAQRGGRTGCTGIPSGRLVLCMRSNRTRTRQVSFIVQRHRREYSDPGRHSTSQDSLSASSRFFSPRVRPPLSDADDIETLSASVAGMLGILSRVGSQEWELVSNEMVGLRQVGMSRARNDGEVGCVSFSLLRNVRPRLPQPSQDSCALVQTGTQPSSPRAGDPSPGRPQEGREGPEPEDGAHPVYGRPSHLCCRLLWSEDQSPKPEMSACKDLGSMRRTSGAGAVMVGQQARRLLLNGRPPGTSRSLWSLRVHVGL